MIDEWVNQIHEGDVLATLREMPESSAHMAMTSPPYWGLRDYGVDGQIGLEDSLGEYVETIVEVGEELRRVLRDDGNWWLNLGDSYAGSWGAQSKDETSNNLPQDGFPDKNPGRNGRLKRKNKMLIPHRVAIGLQEAGWVVRSDCVWAKPNPMPHSVKDRLTETKEYVFHLTPEPDYWFDLDSVREPHADHSIERATREDNRHEHSPRQSTHPEETLNPEQFVHPKGKNPGDVFDVTVRPFPEAHFAVYPPELVETPVKATAPPEVCAECGTPYDRETETEYVNPGNRTTNGPKYVGRGDESPNFDQRKEAVHYPGEWQQVCDCGTDETEEGIVLDPFAGAGTTCLVAKRLGRRFVGIELNPDYVAMAQKRVGITVDEPRRLLEEGQETLADGGFLEVADIRREGGDSDV